MLLKSSILLAAILLLLLLLRNCCLRIAAFKSSNLNDKSNMVSLKEAFKTAAAYNKDFLHKKISKKFKCYICDKEYHYEESLSFHMKFHL